MRWMLHLAFIKYWLDHCFETCASAQQGKEANEATINTAHLFETNQVIRSIVLNEDEEKSCAEEVIVSMFMKGVGEIILCSKSWT